MSTVSRLTSAISSALLTIGLIAGSGAQPRTAKAQQNLRPPSTDIELNEAPLAEVDAARTTPTDLRFDAERVSIAADLPAYATRLWDEAYDAADSTVVFIAEEPRRGVEAGDLLAELDKDATWTSTYLNDELGRLAEHVETPITAAYPDNAEALTDDLRSVVNTTWNSGRATTLRQNASQHGMFLDFYEDTYDAAGLPDGTEAHIIAESALNPTASSPSAHGVCQIHASHYEAISDDQPFPDEDNPLLSEWCAKALKAQQAVHDTGVFESTTMFHSGQTNYDRTMQLGRFLRPDKTPFEQYIAGLNAYFSHHDDDYFNALRGNAGRDTRNYPGQVSEAVPVYEAIQDTTRQADLRVIRPDTTYTRDDVAALTGLEEKQIASLNPHVPNGPYTSSTYTFLPDSTSIPGRDVTPSHKDDEAFRNALTTYDFAEDHAARMEELGRFIDKARRQDLQMWRGALRYVKRNEDAFNAYEATLDRRIARLTGLLDAAASPSTGTAR